MKGKEKQKRKAAHPWQAAEVLQNLPREDAPGPPVKRRRLVELRDEAGLVERVHSFACESLFARRAAFDDGPPLPGWGTYRQIKTGAGFKLKNKTVRSRL